MGEEVAAVGMKLSLSGGELHYDVRGDGIPVLLLHAFPLSLAMWDVQARLLEKTHRVVRFDARGFGASSPGDGPLTMERIADDAVALLDHLGLPSAVVCGLSMGGYAAFALVRRHPTRLRALVLADTRAGADAPAARASRAELAERVLKEGTQVVAETMVPKLLGATSLRERPDTVAEVRRITLGNPPRGIANALAGLAGRADSTSTLREIRVPTLVLCGEEDTLTPVSEAEMLAGGIAGARLVTIPKAGHLSSMENPEAFGAALLGFLSGMV
jgi:pimeloyl-ACP methyl ester carboxylesterase